MKIPATPGVYDHIIVHCAATPGSMDIDAYWIDRVHRQKGWSGCGYHVFITRAGHIQWEGTGHPTRKVGKPGAHVGGCGPGWNERSFGVCMAGGVKEDGRTPEDNFTKEQYAALAHVIDQSKAAFGVEEGNVMGHRDLIKLTNAAPKACPCFSVREWRNGYRSTEEYETTEGRLSFDWHKKLRPAPQRGEKLVIKSHHIVKKGETLWSISRTMGVPLADIRRCNPEITGDLITPGQKIKLIR